MSAEIELKELEKDKLIDIILHNEKEIEKLKKEKEKLEKELKKYKNAHTPLPNCALTSRKPKACRWAEEKAKK